MLFTLLKLKSQSHYRYLRRSRCWPRRKHSKYQPVIIRETFIAKRPGSVFCDRGTENRHALRSRRVHSSRVGGGTPPLHPIFTPMPASLVETIYSSRFTRTVGTRRSPRPLRKHRDLSELVQYSKQFEFPIVFRLFLFWNFSNRLVLSVFFVLLISVVLFSNYIFGVSWCTVCGHPHLANLRKYLLHCVLI